ncbi:hypothetical protein KC19_10G133400 [Ceratodon purpureus]|uniref:Uncharacterized protein n=1 Tax=Ceratodon purpureus TaxID=3225 RepID=A0A8T0GNR9_CERPU|nr:hypothetical protein KC19_10G133400 [Ceratodon purpureus]
MGLSSPVQLKMHFDILTQLFHLLDCQTLVNLIRLTEIGVEILRQVQVLREHINRLCSALPQTNLRPHFTLFKVKLLFLLLIILKISPRSLPRKQRHVLLQEKATASVAGKNGWVRCLLRKNSTMHKQKMKLLGFLA